MGEHGFRAFRMMLDGPNAATRGGAQHQRTGDPAARAGTQPRCMIEDLVDAGIRKAGELDFGDRPETLSSEPDRNAGDTDLGEGGVDDPIPAMELEQAVGRTEDAAVDPDVFAEHDDARIIRHRPMQREIHRLHEVDLAHASPAARCSASSSCSARSTGIFS
jgi:hypothetical protein